MYKASYLGNEVKITKRQFETFTPEKIVELLNRKGFPLGSGHEHVQMLVRCNKTGVINCTPYRGAFNQTIEFEPI